MSRRSPAVPDPGATALALAAGRTAIAASILAAPELLLRSAGVDTVTARRVSWLTRMMAVRDGALGVGALAAPRAGKPASAWLVAGAVSDAVDAVVVAGAVRRGTLGGVRPVLLTLGAGAAAGAGLVTAARLRRA